VLRQVWKRLAHKQWLIFYPVALAAINTLAFLAVYGAAGSELAWGPFFHSNFDRWTFVHEHFVSGFSFTPALGVAVFSGLAACVFAAMLRAPMFRAIAGSGYPLTPRSWEETGGLTLFYVFYNLVVVALIAVTPVGGVWAEAGYWAAQVVTLLLVYADYIIVFEGMAFIPAVRRSAKLLSRRWPPVLVIFVIFFFVGQGIRQLYAHYYGSAEGVFLLLPVTEIFVWSFFQLMWDLLFIFTYEHVRNSGR
jgi:hypothetical protein